MKEINFRGIVTVFMLSFIAFGFNPRQVSSETEASVTVPQYEHNKTQSTKMGQSMTLKAMLVDPEIKAQKREATIKVTVTGVDLVDPATAHEQPKNGQGHLHYQVDNGPVIATTTTKLSFHALTPGQHTIKVMLAANDHSPLGPHETLNVTIR